MKRMTYPAVALSGIGLSLLAATTVARAAYQPAPSWSPMVMVDVAFDGANISVAAQPKAIYLHTAPQGTFDPTEAWSVLNGTAFSRQLGWYDPANDDFYATYQSAPYNLPANLSIWIEKLSQSSPQLKTYVVTEADSPNGPYTPIFGTPDPVTGIASSARWKWDGFMDHNAVAVDLADLSVPNQQFVGVYKLYIGDAGGNAVAGYGTYTETWTWTGPATVPEPTFAATAGIVAMGLMARRRHLDRDFRGRVR